jgi:predicted nuclease of predicted toxin-antitoxin system
VVLRRAHDEERVLMTFDKDFGTLIVREQSGPPASALLVQLPDLSEEELVRFVVETVRNRDDWPGHFAVIEPERIRMCPLPAR